MIEEIFVGITGLMLFGVLIYFVIKYINTCLQKERTVLEKREKFIDLMIEKYSVSADTENK